VRRRRLIALFLPALAILLAAGSFFILLHTQPGARWLLHRADGLLPGQLRAASLAGDLQSGLRLQQVRYEDGGLNVQADRIEARLDFDLLPPSLAVRDLEFGTLEIRSDSAGDEGSASLGEVLEGMALPLPIHFENVRGERIAWQPAPDGAALEIRGLALSAAWFKSLELEDVELALTAPAVRWQGRIAFGLQAPFSLDVDGSASVEATPGLDLEEPVDLGLRLEGDLEALRLDVRAEEPSVVLGGTVNGLVDTPSWDLQLSGQRLPWPLNSEAEVLLESFSARSYGWIDDYGLELDTQIADPPSGGLQGLRARLVGTGDQDGLQIDLLDVRSDAMTLGGSGRLNWADGFEARAEVAIEHVDPAPWLEAWGEAPPVSGRLDLAWSDDRLEFTGKDLEAPGTIARLAGSGTFDPADGQFEAALDWRGLTWPPASAPPVILSNEGRARVTGRPEAWNLDAELGLSGRDLPEGRLRVLGAGDTEQMALEIPRGELLGGRLQGTVDARWAPDFSWSVSALFEGLATAPLLPGWPGRIGGEATLRGQGQPLALDVDRLDLTGTLRGQPVIARGAFQYRDGRLTARDLHLGYADSELSLDGDLASETGLAFRGRIDSLGDFPGGATGSLGGSGTISLDPNRPRLVVDLEGRSLAWGEYSLDSLMVETPPGEEAEVRAEARGIAFGDNEIDALTLVTGSRRPLDEIQVGIGVADTLLEVALSGRVADWTEPLAAGWRGSLQHLRWDGGAMGWVELEDSTALSLNGEAVTLAPACFSGSRQGRLCLEGGWRPRGENFIEASLEDASPNLALTLADSDLTFSQLLSGTVAWRQSGESEPRATVDLSISAGEVSVEGEPILATGRGRFGFEIADGALFAGNLDIPVPGSGGIDTDFSAPDLTDGLASPAQGRFQLNLRDIEPVLELLPSVEGSSGPVAAEMRISGTLADPRFTGHASLVRGRISHFASGLVLEDLQLAGAVYEFDQTELTGRFRAGKGHGSIRVVLNFDDILSPEVLFQLEGKDLTLVNVPDLNVTADPDMRLMWRERTLDVAGRVTVPAARLSPRYLPTTGATESPDVVIVAGVDPNAPPEQAATSDWRIGGEVELELGKDVSLQLERAQARLRGTARFTWDGPLIPTASGGFDLSGEILAYGQLLNVSEGRVNFADRPADNPFLTIRAEREIYGNSQVRRAGVLVTGPLKSPVLETYTDPMTTRERALALLVTGSDFNYEQGVGAVEVGMYVAPKLFVSYGVGLFDDQNVISARYDLGKGFGIKATSGQRETGADISYTIER
jgi:translocation and assembly module TamB